MGGGRKEKKR
jgi:hypothetical protein